MAAGARDEGKGHRRPRLGGDLRKVTRPPHALSNCQIHTFSLYKLGLAVPILDKETEAQDVNNRPKAPLPFRVRTQGWRAGSQCPAPLPPTERTDL